MKEIVSLLFPKCLKMKPIICRLAPICRMVRGRGDPYSCCPGFREFSSTTRSYSSRNSSSSPESPKKAPHFQC